MCKRMLLPCSGIWQLTTYKGDSFVKEGHGCVDPPQQVEPVLLAEPNVDEDGVRLLRLEHRARFTNCARKDNGVTTPGKEAGDYSSDRLFVVHV